MIARGVIGAVLVGLLVGGALAYASLDDPSPRPIDRSALRAYEQAVVPIVQEGGKVVELGMKPAMDDLEHRHVVPPAAIGTEGDAWVRSLQQLRGRLSHVRTPVQLKQATSQFLVALDGYTAAARAFAEAARSTGTARAQFIRRGIALAESADHTYDRGSAVLQRARRSLGLPPSPNFPQPT